MSTATKKRPVGEMSAVFDRELEDLPAELRWREWMGRIGRVASITGQARSTLIPTVIDQNPCAHLRMPRDMIFHGWSMRLFQAWQHSATMSS